MAMRMSLKALAVAVSLIPRVCCAQPHYTLTDLGSLGGGSTIAYGVNDLGQVVGASTISGLNF